jgi:hypothetical protein
VSGADRPEELEKQAGSAGSLAVSFYVRVWDERDLASAISVAALGQ